MATLLPQIATEIGKSVKFLRIYERKLRIAMNNYQISNGNKKIIFLLPNIIKGLLLEYLRVDAVKIVDTLVIESTSAT
jgi:hypothetical protein